jgi:osmoprotectant transport system ATP-binding protein
MLAVVDVEKRYGEHVALAGVSFEIEAGRTCALIGPSGCGKSTLLRLFIGLIRPTAGEVRFNGEGLQATDLRSLRRRFGYAIQSGGLFPHLTAFDNAALPARRAGTSAESCRERVHELAAMVHLPEEMLGKYPRELSGGQRQRVALMRALVLDPEVLLLDEPLGALDPLIRAELQHELRELFDRLGKTVVLVTHDLAEAAYLAPNDIVLLREGEVEQRGTFAELRAQPADSFVARFVAAQVERVEALVSSANGSAA